jgi:uncharacterized delta-60 repeat protein
LEVLEDRCVPSAAGVLDPTFGNGAGYVTTSLASERDNAYVPLIQPDGKIIASGTVFTATNSSFGVARYNSDGSLDTSFGSGGTGRASFGPNSAYSEWAALYPTAGTVNDGKIVLAGWYTPPAGKNQVAVTDFALARFNTNGTLDATFGTGGEVLTSFSAGAASGGVVVTSAGQIVAAGNSGSNLVLARYNANGSLDSTFGQGGKIVTPFAQGVDEESMTQQPDGKLLVFADTGGHWLLVRYNADGSLDAGFGSGGVVNSSVAGQAELGVAVFPSTGSPNDGKIVAVGQSSNGGTIARFNANGSLDSTFGTGGVVSTNISLRAEAIAADGQVVVAGNYYANGVSAAVARFNADGSPDNSFGTGGIVTTTISGGGGANGVALQPDGNIVIAGTAPSSTNGDFLVARYLPKATAPYFTLSGPSSTTAGAAGAYTISVFNADGSADTGYSGTVQITSSDPQAVLPAPFTISGGTASFMVSLKTAGAQALTASDLALPGINGSDTGIQVKAAAAVRFVLSGPSSVRSGSTFSLTVTALDAYGNIATGFAGTVQFSDSANGATLPGNYNFTAADAGVHTFSAIKLKTKGKQTITVKDSQNGSILGSLTIDVT